MPLKRQGVRHCGAAIPKENPEREQPVCRRLLGYGLFERLRAGWAYFVSFQQAAKDFAELSQTRLTMPVLAIGGEKANGEVLGQQVKIVATDATMVVQRCRNLSAARVRARFALRWA